MAGEVANLMACSSDGRVFAVAHNSEILSYSGIDGSPLWRDKCRAEIIVVGAYSTFVLSLDENGAIHHWNARSGELIQTVNTNRRAQGMAFAENGDCAIISVDGILIVRGSNTIQFLELPLITAAQWSGDSRLLACGDGNGCFKVYSRSHSEDTLASHPVARMKVDEPIISITNLPDGSWIASAGFRIWQLDLRSTISKVLVDKTQKPTKLVKSSPNGRLICFTMGERDVLAFHLNPSGLAGIITYQDRVITGVEFGIESRLAISLDTGDGNIIDFDHPQGGVIRTDPHPGRANQRWMLNVSMFPQSENIVETADDTSTSHHQKIPGWAGPLIDAVIGLLIGIQISRAEEVGSATIMILTATLLGLAGGGVVWLMDTLKKK